MTVREMLLHTSGMSSHCDVMIFHEINQRKALAAGQIVELVGEHAPSCRCCYSERKVGSVPVLWSYCVLDMYVDTFTIGDRRLMIYVRAPKMPTDRKQAALAKTAEAAMEQAQKKRRNTAPKEE